MTDLHGAFSAISADAGDRHQARSGGLDTTAAVAEAGRRRRRFTATVALTGVAAAAVVVVGGAAALTSDDPTPLPVATPTPSDTPTVRPSLSPSPTPTPTPTPTPSETAPTPTPTPTPAPSPPAVPVPDPALAACTSAVPQLDPGASTAVDPYLWMGDYGGGIEAEPGAPVELFWSVISGEDLSNRAVTARVDGLWLVDAADWTTSFAVPADGLPDAFPLAFAAGSEGGGGGSEARVGLTTTFVPCAGGAGDVPVGEYGAVALLTLDDGTTVRSIVGGVAVYVGGQEAAAP